MPHTFEFALSVGLLPVIMLALGSAVCALASRRHLHPHVYRAIAVMFLVGTVGAAAIAAYGMRLNNPGIGLTAYSGGVVIDRFGLIITIGLSVYGLFGCLTVSQIARRQPRRAGVFYSLILAVTAAAVLVVSQQEMVMLSVELVLFVVLVGLLVTSTKTLRDEAEVALKYLVTTGLALSLLLYGLALLYGITGTTELTAVRKIVAPDAVVGGTAVVFVIAGLVVLLGAVPWQQLFSTVSAGAAAPIAGFAVATSMLTGTAVIARVMGPNPTNPWAGVAVAIGVATMVYSAFVVAAEHDVRRLIGCACAAQTGYVLVAVGTPNGQAVALFGAVTAGVSVLASLALLGMMESPRRHGEVNSYRGVIHSDGPIGIAFVVALAALGALPPLTGFLARLLLLHAAADGGMVWAMLIGLCVAVIIGVRFIRVLTVMVSPSIDAVEHHLDATRTERLAAVACGALSFFLVILAQPLLAVASLGASALSPQ